MIPPEIRDFETYVVAYSGGKDSTAMLLWALDNLPRERLRVVFCNTGAQWPEVYGYLGYIERELGVEIERVKAGDRPYPPTRNGQERVPVAYGRDLFDMVRIRGNWPNFNVRFCSIFLKQWPLRLYAQNYDNPVSISGIRAEESSSRSGKPPFDMGGDRTSIPVFRPILDWLERDVWEYLRGHHILPNPVYNYASRCGCWCCVLGRTSEAYHFCRLHPDIAQRAADLEEEIGHTWKPRQSIGGLLRQAQAQMTLFEPRPRFPEVGTGESYE